MNWRLPLAFILLVPLSIATAVTSGCLPMARKLAAGTSSTPVPSGPEGLAASLLDNHSMKAVKEADPGAHESLRIELVESLKVNDDLSTVAPRIQSFISEFVLKQLPHKSVEAQKKYMSYRLAMLKKMNEVSPDYAYSIVRGEPYQGTEKELIRISEAMDDPDNTSVADLIKAPTAPPIPQDNAQAEKDLKKVLTSLGQSKLKLLASQAPGSDRLVATSDIRNFFEAYFQFLEEIHKLPDTRAVQLFRLLEELPKDDRLKS